MMKISCVKHMLAAGLLLLMAADAAACSDRKVRRLADRGETVQAIASECDMDEDNVRDIIDAEPAPGGKKKKPNGGSVTPGAGLPSGTPLGQCGCWGYVSPGAQQESPQCSSGYARPQMCPGWCSGGGSPWVGVCS